MRRPMNGRDFLDIAQGLVGGGSEGHWRTAAGRAYYALLLEGRDTLSRWGFSIAGHQPVHASVRLRFSFAADADCKKIGDALDRLVRLRNEADYQLSGSRSFASNIKATQAIAL